MPTNRRTVTTEQDDFYPTPEWCTRALLDNEEFVGTILEPSCGDGAISKLLDEKYPGWVVSQDLYDHGYGKSHQDFLKEKATVPNIITNPPYNIVNKYTLKAIELVDNKVALLVRLAFLEGQERYNTIFNPHPPARIYVFSERITMYKKYAEDKKGSGTTAYAWVVWDKAHKGPTEVKWLIGYKE